MTTLTQAAQELADMFHQAGIPATHDPRDIDLPGAFFSPAAITHTGLDYSVLTIEWDVYIITPDNGNPLEVLSPMLDRLRDITGGRTLRTEALTLINHSPDPLPAIYFTLETESASS